MRKIPVKISSKNLNYDIGVGDQVLDGAGIWAKNCLASGVNKIAIVSNRKVFGLYGDKVVNALRDENFIVCEWLMEDGEEFKNFESLRSLLRFFAANGMTRSDSVLALGGGVVGDLAGFAAATYMRGLQLLQVPTTFLAMIDASVGGKTAINVETGKNLVGAFHQPSGVMVDTATLRTLDKRELAAGFYEAIKHGAIAGGTLLDESKAFLLRYPIVSFAESFGARSFEEELRTFIAKQIAFKAEVVMNDEGEAPERADSMSRKILNFGHTLAHALEKVTKYQYFKHGEAVGYGILAAAEISKRLELLDGRSLQLLNDVVTSVGKLPGAKHVDLSQVTAAFVFDKKMNGEDLEWILLEGIGKPVIIKSKKIPENIVLEAIGKVLAN